MAEINSPQGDSDIEITFDRPIFTVQVTVSKIGKSIDRMKMRKLRTCRILYSECAISISFTQPLAGGPKRLELRVTCEPLVLQLSSMSLICKVLSGTALLLGVEQLHLNVKRPSSEQDGGESKQWLEIIHHFRGTKWVHVAGDHSTSIGLALQLSNKWRETVLPSLQKLCIQGPEDHCVSLREAISSFTHVRQLSGSFIGVEYERPWVGEICETGPSPQRAPIESLSYDIILEIFVFYLEASPKSWPTLAHVCQNWRQIVFTSPRSLHLRLCCEHGTPVSKTLDYWPALPIAVQYGGSSTLDPPAPEDEDNVLAALRQSSRVVTIEEPFSELEELDLLSTDNVRLNLPSIFQWRPRLRSLHLTRIAIPTLLQLSSSRGLEDLQLYDIPSAGYSGMTKLRSLSFRFPQDSLPPQHNFLGLPPSSRTVLPALTCLEYRGVSRYFDNLVSRIDAPRLGGVDVVFFDHSTMEIEASQLGQFIEQIEMQRSPSQADVLFSQSAVSIRFTHSGAPTRFRLRISCKQLPSQLSSMAQILTQLSYFSFPVQYLAINSTEPSNARNVVSEQWLGLFHAFGGAEDFCVASEFGRDALRALLPVDEGHSTVFPALRTLRIRGPLSMSGSLWDAVYAEQYKCHRCACGFKDQRELKFHLKGSHGYQIVCSHCCDFEWLPVTAPGALIYATRTRSNHSRRSSPACGQITAPIDDVNRQSRLLRSPPSPPEPPQTRNRTVYAQQIIFSRFFLCLVFFVYCVYLCRCGVLLDVLLAYAVACVIKLRLVRHAREPERLNTKLALHYSLYSLNYIISQTQNKRFEPVSIQDD
ncbi:hypothetical protein EDB87DRAFT_1619161 [Lactarius vividus]|nr:hypothetical protein EDB87DRAFT_1619161 [Lactarius vividus]